MKKVINDYKYDKMDSEINEAYDPFGSHKDFNGWYAIATAMLENQPTTLEIDDSYLSVTEITELYAKLLLSDIGMVDRVTLLVLPVWEAMWVFYFWLLAIPDQKVLDVCHTLEEQIRQRRKELVSA